ATLNASGDKKESGTARRSRFLFLMCGALVGCFDDPDEVSVILFLSAGFISPGINAATDHGFFTVVGIVGKADEPPVSFLSPGIGPSPNLGPDHRLNSRAADLPVEIGGYRTLVCR